MLKYCGDYAAGTTYDVGDVVVYTDNCVYHKTKASGAGKPCHDMLYWSLLQPPLADAVLTLHNALTSIFSVLASDGETITALSEVVVDDKTLVLKSSSEDSNKVFAITVDDDGDITATEVVEEAGT